MSEQLPWNTSSEKAKELTLADFGQPDEVKAHAKPVRTAYDRKQAAEILKEIIKGGPLISKSGISARLILSIIGSW
jgi:hypothetical protein